MIRELLLNFRSIFSSLFFFCISHDPAQAPSETVSETVSEEDVTRPRLGSAR